MNRVVCVCVCAQGLKGIDRVLKATDESLTTCGQQRAPREQGQGSKCDSTRSLMAKFALYQRVPRAHLILVVTLNFPSGVPNRQIAMGVRV